MIGQLPQIYPDELIYSWLTRYVVYSGILYKKMAFKEIYNEKIYIPSFEFVYGIKDDIFNEMIKYISLDKIIYEHTMFPEYAIFSSKKEQLQLIDLMLNDFTKFRKKIHHFNHKISYLKYCPLCVTEDKNKYGETYWHRTHQLKNINVCPIHSCKLYNIDAETNYQNTVKKLYIANESAKNNTIKFETNYYINALSRYLAKVFNNEINIKYEKIQERNKKMYPFSKVCKMYICDIGTKRKNKMSAASYTNYYISKNAKKIAEEYLKLKSGNNLSWDNLLYKTGLKKIQFKNAFFFLKKYLSYDDIEIIKKYIS